jgi:hypothetical protein
MIKRRRDDLNINTKDTEKLSKYKYLEMRSADVESKGKNCASYNWSIRNN